MSSDYEERAQDADILRWRFEGVLLRVGNEIVDHAGQDCPERFTGLGVLIASLPTVMSFFAQGDLWEDVALDVILFDWIAGQRGMFPESAEAEDILDGVRTMATAAIAGGSLLELDLAVEHLLASIHDR